MALQFLDKDGKPEAQLSAPEFGVYGFSLGDGHTLRQLDRHQGTIVSADLESGAPRHCQATCLKTSCRSTRFPLEFKRSGPIEKIRAARLGGPAAQGSLGGGDWRAGLGRAGARRRDRHALRRQRAGRAERDRHNGKVRWKLDTGKPIRAQPRVIGGLRISSPPIRDSSTSSTANPGPRNGAYVSTAAASRAFPQTRKRHAGIATARASLLTQSVSMSPVATRICTRWIRQQGVKSGAQLPVTS